jgi:hypothetical protein
MKKNIRHDFRHMTSHPHFVREKLIPCPLPYSDPTLSTLDEEKANLKQYRRIYFILYTDYFTVSYGTLPVLVLHVRSTQNPISKTISLCHILLFTRPYELWSA